MGVKNRMDQDNDVQGAQGTVPASSAEDQSSTGSAGIPVGDDQTTVQPSGEDVNAKEQNKEGSIPHARVKEMLAHERDKARREFLAEYQNQKATRDSSATKESEEDILPKEQLGVLQSYIKKELEPFVAQNEFIQATTKHPDLLEHREAMLEHIRSNPNLTIEQAYKLAKFDSLSETERAKGREEAYATIRKKKEAKVESSGSTTVPKPVSIADINIMDRRISLTDIEKMLPHA